MSGAWLAIVQGFAGMRTYNGKLSFSPKLPKGWIGYSFNINYRENNIRISVTQDNIKIENLSGESFEVIINNKICNLSKGNKARVKIILGFAQESKYILLDESADSKVIELSNTLKNNC